MTLINSILNLAALLLWLGWRDARSEKLTVTNARSLIRTLRRAGSSELMRWKYFGGLVTLLLGRAVFFNWIGPAVNWTPKLDLVVISLPFRSELFSRMVLFSLMSFGVTLAFFYLAAMLFSLLHRRGHDTDPLQKFVRVHLGRVDRWPRAGKFLVPFASAVLLWLVFAPLLAHWEIIPPAVSFGARLKQGIILGTAELCLVWKHAIAAVLLLDFLNNYVYFGNHSVWNFVGASARTLLAPLRRLPLRLGRMDFAAVLGILIVLLAGEFLQRLLLKIYPT
jgi:uncharacterized protein YggT (Ycf19 family)